MLVAAADFSDSLQVVTEAVNEADFLAIDAEFSGLCCLRCHCDSL